ncbi:MAG TPA: SulP family inorganic anion transporter, partial [Alphaproteobacteria bacterium]|nr:SulP family inorganic anion transporter [Alphaproteobacteria bacterium]
GGVTEPGTYLQLVFGLTLLKGLLQLAFAAARIGTLLRYVSQSVVVGFTAGAGILIAAGQLPSFLGVPRGAPAELPGAIGTLHALAQRVDEVQPLAVGVGAGSLALLLLLRRLAPRAPAALLTLTAAALVTASLGWEAAGLPVVGAIPRQLPGLTIPVLGYRETEMLLGGAFALATVGAIETVSIGRALALQTNARIRANQEILAQGIASCVGAFFQNVSGSGSFTRTALNLATGGQTRFASLASAATVAAMVLLLAPLASAIPLASLAAILFDVAWRLVDVRFITRLVRTVRSDAVVCLTTLLCALVAPLQQAIFIGIFLNVALYLRKASQLHMTEMRTAAGGVYEEHPLRDEFGRERVLFLQIEGELFFGLSDALRARLARVVASGADVVVLRLKRTHQVDGTILLALEEFVRAMRRRDRHVLLCGLSPELLSTLRRFGLASLVGEENLFASAPGIFSSARRALARAQEIVGPVVETPPADPDPADPRR